MARSESPSFGGLLRRHRKIAGLTQEDLAERAHLSVRGISDLERGARRAPRSDTLALLIDALELEGLERTQFEAVARQLDEMPAPASPAVEAAPFGRSIDQSLVGREQETVALEHHLLGAGPPVFLLSGEPGIGKTRLLKEVTTYAPRAGFTVLTGRCHRRGDQMPYAPLLEALQSYLHMQTPGQLRVDLQGCAWLVRLLPELISGPIEPLPDWLLSSDQEQRLMAQAVERFLTNIAGPSGTLLVFDDLQWAGSDALDLLTGLIRSVGGERLRIVGAYRETEMRSNGAFGEMVADLAQAGLATQRRLAPLTSEHAADLLNRLLPGDSDAVDVTSQMRERLLSRADGVPFFLVSCVQALREGVLEDGVPWDVAQGVRQRAAALAQPAQLVLGIAAVAGGAVSRSLVFRLSDRPEDEVLAALDHACRSGLLAERGEHDYEITHDVIREVVEVDLGAGRRTTLHRHIAHALTSTLSEPPVEAVAYHLSRTDEHAEAAVWLEQAGDAAAARFATAAAIERFRSARERAAEAGLGTPTLSRIDEKLGDLFLATGEFARAREAYRAVLASSESGPISDENKIAEFRAQLLRKEGDTWEKQAEYARALDALDLAEAQGGGGRAGAGLSDLARASIELSRGDVYQRQGKNDAAAAAAARAVELLDTESSTGPEAHALARAFGLQGNIAFNLGDLGRSEALHERSLGIRERLGDQRGSTAAWNNLGRIAFRRADFGRADECFQRALDAAERIGNRQHIAGCWLNLGAVARDRGDLARAEECHQRSLAVSERIGDSQLIEHAWHSLGIVARDRGDLAQAEDRFEQSLSVSERIGDRFTCAHTWHQLGLVALDRGDLGRADDRVQRGLALFESLGDEHGRADCWTTLGFVAGERGDLTASAWHCRAARRLARRLDVPQAECLASIGQARARLRSGRYRAASALLDRAHDVAAARGLGLESTEVVLLRAELQLQGIDVGRGAVDAAKALAGDALQLAEQGGYRREEGLAHRSLGRCAMVQCSRIEAEVHLRAAAEIQSAMGAELEIARTRLVLARLMASNGGKEPVSQDAYRLLSQAREGFLAAGAARDLSEARQVAIEWEERSMVHHAG